MTPVFADTYYYLAIGNPHDAGHQKAMSFAKSATQVIMTTAWVLTELADALCRTTNRSAFAQLLGSIEHDPLTTVIAADPLLFDRGIALYLARPDKDWSLTDCISFVVMTEHNLTDALTADKHYEQAGYRALLV